MSSFSPEAIKSLSLTDSEKKALDDEELQQQKAYLEQVEAQMAKKEKTVLRLEQDVRVTGPKSPDLLRLKATLEGAKEELRSAQIVVGVAKTEFQAMETIRAHFKRRLEQGQRPQDRTEQEDETDSPLSDLDEAPPAPIRPARRGRKKGTGGRGATTRASQASTRLEAEVVNNSRTSVPPTNEPENKKRKAAAPPSGRRMATRSQQSAGATAIESEGSAMSETSNGPPQDEIIVNPKECPKQSTVAVEKVVPEEVVPLEQPRPLADPPESSEQASKSTMNEEPTAARYTAKGNINAMAVDEPPSTPDEGQLDISVQFLLTEQAQANNMAAIATLLSSSQTDKSEPPQTINPKLIFAPPSHAVGDSRIQPYPGEERTVSSTVPPASDAVLPPASEAGLPSTLHQGPVLSPTSRPSNEISGKPTPNTTPADEIQGEPRNKVDSRAMTPSTVTLRSPSPWEATYQRKDHPFNLTIVERVTKSRLDPKKLVEANKKREKQGQPTLTENEDYQRRLRAEAHAIASVKKYLQNPSAQENRLDENARAHIRECADFCPEAGMSCYALAKDALTTCETQIKCIYHQKSDKGSAKRDDTCDGELTGVPYEVIRPRLEKKADQEQADHNRTTPKTPKPSVYERLVLPQTETGEEYCHCGCRLRDAIWGFYLWKSGKISYNGKERGWGYDIPMVPKVRNITIVHLESIGVDLEDLWEYELVGSQYAPVSEVTRLERRLAKLQAQLDATRVRCGVFNPPPSASELYNMIPMVNSDVEMTMVGKEEDLRDRP
ncbi:hypothetical protein V5O48_011364 [Marasmius crinis-equi]|uniref:Uncharacterized protein n=1 Tax=Marasmius crinis-equi TaxID=585013 RepID=A0ABR3F5S7_9AGAR